MPKSHNKANRLSQTKQVATAHPQRASTILMLGPPTRIIIPSIGVDAVVINVGLTTKGALKVPADIAEAGWYQQGPLPGDNGDAVLTGHVVGPTGKLGVFSQLEKLQPGDTMTVRDAIGNSVSFVVRELHSYNAKDSVPTIFFSSDHQSHLNIITCSDWDAKQHVYTKRLVIFTDVKRDDKQAIRE